MTSAMSALVPDESAVIPVGLHNVAAVAALPSPLKLLVPVPATVVIINAVLGLTLGQLLGNSVLGMTEG